MFSQKYHRYLFLFGIYSFAFGMMLGAVPTSIPQFILLGNWLIEGDFKRKWQQLKANKIAWIICSLFFIHLIGLFYTTDYAAALNDIRVKLPLLFIPLLLFTTKPLDEREFKKLFYCFIVGSLFNTLWCFIYNFLLHPNSINNVRSASRFMSHIRLGLYLNVAIASCFYFMYSSFKKSYQLLFAILSGYFIFSLFALGLASGIVNLILIFIFVLFGFIFKQRLYVKLGALLFIVLCVFFLAGFVVNVINDQLVINKTENNIPHNQSSRKRGYLNYTSFNQKENGNYVFINIQPTELKNEWQYRFPRDSFSYMPHPHNLERYHILLRYMASKGLNKDSIGFSKLSDIDIANIKNNITNYKYPQWNFLQKRIYEFIWEYDEFANQRNVNGHSLTMRFYFWKAALVLIKQNFVFGVGTGDVQIELNKVYSQTNSPLSKDWYKHPHNQFITITLALGGIGLIIFLLSLFYPIIKLKSKLHALFWPYFLILCMSFILEDTLESQAGLTFYAFFYTLFISQAYFKKQQSLAG